MFVKNDTDLKETYKDNAGSLVILKHFQRITENDKISENSVGLFIEGKRDKILHMSKSQKDNSGDNTTVFNITICAIGNIKQVNSIDDEVLLEAITTARTLLNANTIDIMVRNQFDQEEYKNIALRLNKLVQNIKEPQ